MVSKFLTAALAVASVACATVVNNKKFNAYWGQSGLPGEQLRDRCDEVADYITLSFVNSSPEHNPSGWPSINFAGHCWATAYDNNGVPSQLLSNCMTIKNDLQYCRDKGIKMLLSIGGVWNQQANNYKVGTEQNARDFADFLWKAFGPYDAKAGVPRPFDSSADVHSQVDGFDLDLELDSFGELSPFKSPWIAMVDQFRSHSSSVIITAAPQCPASGPSQSNAELIQKAQFDALFIQFYNNPVCDLIPGNTPGDKFNYMDWENVIASSAKSKNAKLFVGVPGAPSAAGSGYIDPTALKNAICSFAKRPSFGGVMVWGMYAGSQNKINNKSFNQNVQDILAQCGGTATVTSTTTTTSTWSTRTSTSTSSTRSSTSSTATSTSTSSSSSTRTSTSTTGTSSSTATSTSSSTSTGTSSTGTTTGTSSSTQSTSSSSTGTGSSSSTQTTDTSSSSSTGTTTSTTCDTTSSTDTSSSTGTSSTGTSSTGSSSSSSGQPTNTGSSSSSSVVTTAPPTTTSKEMTTSTVYTTTTYTITSCAASVTNCPARVTTETIALYTTVCPVTKTSSTAAPTQTPEQMTTSTVYKTRTYTITKCPATVTNCPVGKVTTETIPWYTTVCPVTPTSGSPKPTGQPSGSQPLTTTTLHGTTTIVKTQTQTVPGSSKVETSVKPNGSASQPAGNKCPGGPNCPPATTVAPTGTRAPSGPSGPVVGKPTSTVVPVGGTSSVAAGLVALIAAQIFLL